MIPTYLQGKSAAQICDGMRYKTINEGKSSDSNERMQEYVEKLEVLLLLAVKDALMNADATGKLHMQRAYDAECRAIAFLNIVLPYDVEKDVVKKKE